MWRWSKRIPNWRRVWHAKLQFLVAFHNCHLLINQFPPSLVVICVCTLHTSSWYTMNRAQNHWKRAVDNRAHNSGGSLANWEGCCESNVIALDLYSIFRAKTRIISSCTIFIPNSPLIAFSLSLAYSFYQLQYIYIYIYI
jgi:hypothetical protein